MPQFDVFTNPVTSARRAYPLVINLQSDLISSGTETVVAPMALRRNLSSAAGRLTPAVAIDDQEYIVLTSSITSLPARELERRIANLASHRQSLMAAVDLLFFGI
jgi:toxin CcdB